MPLADDSPPFTSLRDNSTSFKSVLDRDVSELASRLDAEVSRLVCDPEALASGAKSGNVHVEFSMAKFAIMGRMREMYEELERGWVEHLDAMREEFLQKVELFLAGTRLEVKSPLMAMRKSPAGGSPSSLYPKLFNTAKSIPVIGSLLQRSTEESSSEDEQPQPAPVLTPRQNGRTPKRVTIVENLPVLNSSSRRRGNQAAPNVSFIDVEEVEPIEVKKVETPVKRGVRGRKSTLNAPVSAKKESANTPVSGRRNVPRNEIESSEEMNDISVIEVIPTGRRSAVKQPTVEKATPGRRGRTPRKKPNEREAQAEIIMEISDDEDASAVQKTPRQVQFALGLDPNDDLEIYSPDFDVTRSAPRRKTVVTRAVENFPDINLTPESTRGRNKRKTFAGSQLSNSVVAPPSPKRFKKSGGRSSMAAAEMEDEPAAETSNHLRSEEGANSPWCLLSEVGPSVPPRPGVYELKVSQAKKAAYIGDTDSLRKVLTLHKLKQSSGHKHLDKFVERNMATLLVRYAYCPDHQGAKREAKARVEGFVTTHQTTPAYN